MENETLLDYKSETIYHRLISRSLFEKPKKASKDIDRCVVYCKKIGSNIFSIQGGLAFITEEDHPINPDMPMITCPTKTLFIFK